MSTAEEKPMFRKDFKIKTSAVVISLLALSLVFLIVSMSNLQKRRIKEIGALKEKLTAVSNRRATLQEALMKVIRKKTQYKLSLQEKQEREKALNDQLAQLSSELANKTSQIVNLDTELKRSKNENYTLNNKINQLAKEKDLLNERLTSFQQIQENLQKKIKRLLTRTKVELGEVIVKPPVLNGKILKANKKYNFVIIDLGKNDGIQPGMNLMAYREENPIGEIKIERVYDELSVGNATFEWRGNELDVGDTVKGKG